VTTLEVGDRLGSYEILALLGAGGMGQVYRARDTRLDRLIAIKVLHADAALSPEALARFEREARSISQLSHPHICPLFDIGQEGAIRFLVMPLLDGETLAAVLASAPLSPAATLRYATEMADALDAAHRAGLVHRDIKPANVMVTKSGIKLLDFGLAKSSSAAAANVATVGPLTASGAVAGTVQYMAPEQLDGRGADHRSDIWALGAVIYEMATGERVFRSAPHVISPRALDQRMRALWSRSGSMLTAR
jgi:eukaryotic-like serine/threonine-protein kinase